VLARARLFLRDLGNEATVVTCAASALLIVSHYQAGTGYFRIVFGAGYDNHPALGALTHLYWFGASFLLYLVMPLIVALATRGSFHRAYGLGLGDWRAGFAISALFLAVMLPATYVASKMKAFEGMYPLAGQAAFTLRPPGGPDVISWKLFLLYEFGYLLYFVAWEFFFRGWWLNAMLPKFGRAGALLMPVSAFAVMHFGKAELEAMGSIVAGIALGILALRTRSFWYGAALHGAVAVWMDWLSAREYLLRP
jgi:membrane protease YdiL (CAAX protease family)